MTNQDNWKHRSAGMICDTCIWYVPKALRSEEGVSAEIPGGIGRCRRRCPTMNGFPVVFRTDWCGDHRLDENKV